MTQGRANGSFLLIGANSEIGAATLDQLRAAGETVFGTTRRPASVEPAKILLDLAHPLGDWRPPRGTIAACIFIAVARLAACAADPAGSALINVEQTFLLAERLLGHGIHVLFLSTNQVFDGSRPHAEPDWPTSPVSEYGRQKARTEAALRELMARGAPVAILRLAKVVSPSMALLDGWVEALAGGRPIRAFHDMSMAPAPVAMVATAIHALMRDRTRGIFQLTGPEDLAYADIGRRIASRLGVPEKLVIATAAADAGMPEGATPRHTTLESGLLAERYNLKVSDPWAVLEPIVDASAARLRAG